MKLDKLNDGENYKKDAKEWGDEVNIHMQGLW